MPAPCPAWRSILTYFGFILQCDTVTAAYPAEVVRWWTLGSAIATSLGTSSFSSRRVAPSAFRAIFFALVIDK